MALAIAGDPDLAQQVAVLTQLHSVVIEASETPEIDFHQAPAEQGHHDWYIYAASIAFLIFVDGSTLLSLFHDRPATPRWFEVAVNLLETWPDKSDRKALSTAAVAPARSLARAYVPDLSAAKLVVNHVVERTEPAVGNLMVIGYRGTRGCRIALAIFDDSGSFPLERTIVRNGDIRAYAWRAGRMGYAIIADGMDVSRFRLIVETVRETTLRHQAVDAETRIAVGESRRRSAPYLT